eukprot:TRINITY_DN130_c0_g1_i1.p3 TRINITY_DN130_c0_g1~~TRINITY_DN130_c0_g1_i1.p3  ORF type:complete len:120 (-),score=8.01 TRINITY_DN130_c0_g1_i1:696-1055(-)
MVGYLVCWAAISTLFRYIKLALLNCHRLPILPVTVAVLSQDFLNTWTNLIVNDVVNSIDSRAHLEGNVAEGESDAQAFGDKTKAIGNQWATVVEGQYSGAGGKAIAATCSSSSSACSSV